MGNARRRRETRTPVVRVGHEVHNEAETNRVPLGAVRVLVHEQEVLFEDTRVL